MELNELANICKDFEEQLTDMQDHLVADIEKIDEKKKSGAGLQDMLIDENTGKFELSMNWVNAHNLHDVCSTPY